MNIKSVTIEDLQFRRPGLTKISYLVDYGGVKRRGEIIYDTVSKKFLTNVSEIKLLAAVCSLLATPKKVSLADSL